MEKFVLILIGAPLGAIITASVAMFIYRKQKTWEKRYETAMQMMVIAYRLQKSLKRFRSPIAFANEWANPTDEEMKAASGEEVNEFKTKNYIMINRRLKDLQEEIIRPTYEIIPRCIFSFGEGSDAPLHGILTLTSDVINARKELLERDLNPNNTEDKDMESRRVRYFELIAYHKLDNDKVVEIASEIVDSIKLITKEFAHKGNFEKISHLNDYSFFKGTPWIEKSRKSAPQDL